MYIYIYYYKSVTENHYARWYTNYFNESEQNNDNFLKRARARKSKSELLGFGFGYKFVLYQPDSNGRRTNEDDRKTRVNIRSGCQVKEWLEFRWDHCERRYKYGYTGCLMISLEQKLLSMTIFIYRFFSIFFYSIYFSSQKKNRKLFPPLIQRLFHQFLKFFSIVVKNNKK